MTTNSTQIPQFTRGDRLRKAREKTGLSTRDFALEIGVSQKTVNNAEADKPIRRVTLLAWSMRSGVPLEWLESGWAPRESNSEPAGSVFSLVA